MTKAATEAVNRLFRPDFKYCKAEALLLDLRQLGEFTYDLYPYCSLLWLTKSWGLDEINGSCGRCVLRLASVPAAPG